MTPITEEIQQLYSFEHNPSNIETWNLLFESIASILSYDIMRAKEKMLQTVPKN